MNNFLIDSSVWIEYFRAGKEDVFDHVDTLLDQDRIVLCGIVEL